MTHLIYGLVITLLTIFAAHKGQVSVDTVAIVCIIFSLTLKD